MKVPKTFEELRSAVVGRSKPIPLAEAGALQAGDWLVGDTHTLVHILVPGGQTSVAYRYVPSGTYNTRPSDTFYFQSSLRNADFWQKYPNSLWTGHRVDYQVVRNSPLNAKLLTRLTMTGYLGTHSFSIGTDPELFAFGKSGEVIPAWDFLGAKSPCVCEYWDGVQAELARGGGTCCDGLCSGLYSSLWNMRVALEKKFPAAKLQASDCVQVPLDLLAKAQEKHVIFGCKPSKNAYGHLGLVVEQPREFPWRFAGGHLHLGTQFRAGEGDPVEAVKALDAILGVASVCLFPDDNPIRRQYYGLAGEYRLPKHGLEYRTLSNAWLRAPQLFYLIMGMARLACGVGQSRLLSKLWSGREEEVVECINNCDVSAAKKMVRRNARLYAAIVERIIGHYNDPSAKKTLKIILNGYQTVFPEPLNLDRNWQFVREYSTLDGRWGTFIRTAKP